jgi:polyketide cyclase/dehydrase/lipid transport protein
VTGRTESGSIESDAARAELVSLLADGTSAPRWAPAFADVVERDGDAWRATKDGRSFLVRIEVHARAGTVDYLREIAPGRFGGAYLRVVPRPGGGSVVTLTLPTGPGADPAAVRATLKAELAALVALVDSR